MSRTNRFSELTRRLLLVLPLLIAAGAAQVGVSAAQNRTLDAPRANGSVGERYDGYAVVRDTAQTGTLKPLVDGVNAERRQVYTQRATSEKAAVDQIGRVYAAEIFKSAPAGTWFLQESGQWVKK